MYHGGWIAVRLANLRGQPQEGERKCGFLVWSIFGFGGFDGKVVRREASFSLDVENGVVPGAGNDWKFGDWGLCTTFHRY